MLTAIYRKLDCLEYLIAKGANREAKNNVSAAQPAACRPCTTPTPTLTPTLTPRSSCAASRRKRGSFGLGWGPRRPLRPHLPQEQPFHSPLQEGKTVLDVAEGEKHTEIVACLERAAAAEKEAAAEVAAAENPAPSIAGPVRCRYVIADVLQRLAGGEQDAELLLDRRRPIKGLPWEVKDCDGMNPMEHAHGQSDFQRIFANCKKGSLWLFTRDKVAPSQHGRENFAVFCEQVLVHSADRYNEVILARRLERDDEVPCDKLDALQRVVLARWDAESRQVMWRPQVSQPPPPPGSQTP